MRLVAKIGTSSITDALGVIDEHVVDTLCDQLAALRGMGHEVILVSSGAVSAGVAALGHVGETYRHADAAGDLGRRPEPPHGHVQPVAGSTSISSPRRCCSCPTISSTAGNICTPAKRCCD